VYVIRDDEGDGRSQRELLTARWGLVPTWAKDPAIGARMINARVETAAEKPAFRQAFAKRRCLVPADGYYEWYTPTAGDAPRGRSGRPVKQPFYIHRADGAPLAMAGLLSWWRAGDSDDWVLTMAVLTTEAAPPLRQIHDRMPVLVDGAQWGRWLDPQWDGAGAIGTVLVPGAGDELVADPVSTAVNSVRNNGPELIEPIRSQ
jgi:putative SOS response-associated peptidase YedK